MQKCPKYPLRPEYSDSDIYYFHFRDGSLYLPAEKLFYKNNDYCVQNALSDFGNQVKFKYFIYFYFNNITFFLFIKKIKLINF